MNSSKTSTVYICEYHKGLNIVKYYKSQFLADLNMWGRKRKITENTFRKREKEGFKVEYYQLEINHEEVRNIINDAESLIDIAIQTNDREWFHKLSLRIKIAKNLI